jgi:hypothetical protein
VCDLTCYNAKLDWDNLTIEDVDRFNKYGITRDSLGDIESGQILSDGKVYCTVNFYGMRFSFIPISNLLLY